MDDNVNIRTYGDFRPGVIMFNIFFLLLLCNVGYFVFSVLM